MSCRLVFKNPANGEGHGCSSLASVALFLLILSLSFSFIYLFFAGSVFAHVSVCSHSSRLRGFLQ